ncbi:hypothetical protein MPSEU_000965700 [Mayamaea pseudoterrestris]|nr:hypothetical protein MPSEU_000965000 [Mayamaea pseudoterrestris]GKZ00123.1 hypothetical protein MPSEU_000965700 [Mayamaea pseudoterrestris]
MSPSNITNNILVDYKSKDYRGFIFVIHETHGLLLLHCTRKLSKGPHFQTPGGHLDEQEFIKAAVKFANDRDAQLLWAARSAAARELYEETGMDVRSSLERIQPVTLHTKSSKKLDNELKNRLFFKLVINDSDFLATGVAPLGSIGMHLKLKLSQEHQGYQFVSDPSAAADMLQQHSGSKVTEALKMALANGSIVLPQQSSASVTPSSQDSRVNPAVTASQRRRKTDKHKPHEPNGSHNGRAAAAPVVNLFPEPERKSWTSCWFTDC